jgi:predicted HicB family RNase H-like nuclease
VIHEDRDMGRRNVTLNLDDETLRKARMKAAERGISLSKLVSEVLVEELRRAGAERQRSNAETAGWEPA